MPSFAPESSTDDESSSLFADVVPASQRRLIGRKLRKICPRTEQAKWELVANRHNIIDLLKSQESYRREELVPLRYERMAASPFAYLRGSALTMADDFSRLPNSSLTVQCCGDCHLANFGLFATPERNIIFDLNDFDETHPGPWEWDLKRLAVSFAVAVIDKGLNEAAARRCTATLVSTYRESMAMFAEMKTLDIWYYKFRFDDLIKGFKKPENRQLARERLEKLKKKRSHMGALEKLTQLEGGRRRIKDDPPLMEHPDAVTAAYVRHILDNYMQTLAPARQALLKRYRFVDAAFKVVGVGSVGTRAGILLLQGESDGDDPVFLQMKQATSSVLEPYTSPCRFVHQGQRVVVGQTLLQAASDTFLGWATGPGGVHYYLRQFMDVKVSMPLEELHEEGMHNYARSCAVTLARAHARSGDPAKLSGYMGNSETLDEAITDFAITYMKQNELDYQTFLKALNKGQLEAARAH